MITTKKDNNRFIQRKKSKEEKEITYFQRPLYSG